MEELEPKAPYEMLEPEERLERVELLVIEVENVLTDGRVQVDHKGRETIVISQRDAYALKMWQDAGFTVVVISRRGLEAARLWAEARGIIYREHTGAKTPAVQRIVFENQSNPSKLCYLGGEMDDLPPMMIAGVSVATSDSPVWVRDGAGLVLQKPGGQGAVRELVERILEQHEIKEI